MRGEPQGDRDDLEISSTSPRTAPVSKKVKNLSESDTTRDANVKSTSTPEAYPKRMPHPYWRPVKAFDLAPEFADATGIPAEKCAKLRAALVRLRGEVGRIQAEEAVVVGDDPKLQYVYLPAGNKKWKELKASFTAEITEAAGDAVASYLLSASKNDLDVWTGGFGETPRVMKFHLDDTIQLPGEPNSWQVTVATGPNALEYVGNFPAPVQRALEKAVSMPGWVDVITFNTEIPDYLQGIVSR
jgi:hypothetical protein